MLSSQADWVTDLLFLDDGNLFWKGVSEGYSARFRRETIGRGRLINGIPEPYRPKNWPVEFVARIGEFGFVPRGVHVAHSHDRRVMAALQQGDVLSVWNIESQQSRCLIPLPGAGDADKRFFMALNEDGSFLAVAGLGVEDLVDLETITDELKKEQWAKVSDQSVIGIFDTNTGKFVNAIPNAQGPISFVVGEKSQLVACSSSENAVIKTHLIFRPARTLFTLKPDLFPSSLIADKSSNRVLVTGNRKLLVSRLDNGQQLQSIADEFNLQSGGDTMIQPVTDLYYTSPDGQLLVIALDDEAQVWDATEMKTIAFLGRHAKRITDVAFSADRSRIATASQDGTVKLWDTQTGRLLWTFFTPGVSDSPIWFVTFRDGDQTLIAASEHGIIRWEM